MTGDHVQRNRDAWAVWAADYRASAQRHWTDNEVTWGVFGVPDGDVELLPDVDGKDVVELGCGTAYISAWIARRGGRPVGVDATSAQLVTAAELQREHGLPFPLVQADAEAVPLRDATFDVAISEYGASIWCEPDRWVAEAARLLRPGGELIFLVNGTLLMLCMPDADAEGPATDRLRRDYFGMHRFEWEDDPQRAVDFHIGYGDWIRVLRRHGFVVDDLVELRPRPGATTTFPYVTPEWAARWPCEEVWKARKAGS